MITPAELQAAFAKAPEHLREYIDSNEMAAAFQDIRDTYKLHIDHAGNLAIAIDAVILGMKQFNDLPAMLKEGLNGVDDATREKVLKEVNDKIFVPLREISKKRAQEMAEKIVAPPRPEPTAATTLRTVSEPVLPPEALQSVVEQKMPTAVVLQPSPPASGAETKAPTPETPPKYHGTDPYREPL